MYRANELHTIIPIAMDDDWSTKQQLIDQILERHNNFGFKNFSLFCPGKGYRSTGYPSKEKYRELAETFKSVKDDLREYGIELSWWNTLTIKNGGGDFSPIVKENGEEHPFASCPLDPVFIKRFSEDVAMFAKIAKPAFIIFEDDYSILASNDCFCKHHLDEFARRMGKFYTREEIKANLHAKNQEGIEFTKQWRQLRCDALSGLAAAVRKEVDKESPEIPMGYMQAGYAIADGNCTDAVCRAFAGKNHRPFSRFHGTGYGRFDQKNIPYLLYSPLFDKQHLGEDFIFLHESDTFPHLRFFRSGKQMRALMANVFSIGFDGSIFICNQIADDSGEEKAYAKMYQKEEKRFTVVSNNARLCNLRGAEIHFDTFNNTLLPYDGVNYPYWSHSIGRFGIPFSTKNEPVVFWDVNDVRFSNDETIKKNLSKVIFLDGLAAKHLTEMGYSEYIGVKVGEPVLDIYKRLRYDLGAREVICDEYAHLSVGRNMHPAHMFSPDGMGTEYKMTVIDDNTKVVTELHSYDKKLVLPAMTYFENSLGGKVIVLDTAITNHNNSQSHYNYRKQKLVQHFITATTDEYVIAKKEPDIFVIQNEAKNEKKAGFIAMLTLTNLCDDELDSLSLVLPTKYRNKTYLKINQEGEFEPIRTENTEDGITVLEEFCGLETKYILIK